MTKDIADFDVVIVGAGTAGLAAARALQTAGQNVIVLEAASHIGGRCITATSGYTHPFDKGGSWLHSADINPLARIAERENVKLRKRPWERSKVHVKGQNLSPDQVAAFSNDEDKMWDSIRNHAATKEDVAAETAISPTPWSETVKLIVPLWLAADADVVSAKDVESYEHTEHDWLIEGGLGNFVAEIHANLPIRLNCPVQQIDYSGSNVEITTPLGQISARHVVVTVSTGVLRNENINFHPKLPGSKISALNGLPIGLLNKVLFEFAPSFKAALPGEAVDYQSGDKEFCTLLFGFYDGANAVGFVGGRFAEALERQGKGAATAYCQEALQAVFGNDAAKLISKTDETAWNATPTTLGAYSYAKPGQTHARTELARPVDDRLFFAGEATIPEAYATVHGAYLSGLRAANQVLTAFKE